MNSGSLSHVLMLLQNLNYVSSTSAAEVGAEDSAEVKLSAEKLNDLVAFCAEERSRKEM
jgi:hypothetical protein